MARKRLTQRDVDRLSVPAGQREVWLWDEAVRGLGVRALSTGVKTWYVQARGTHGVVRERIGDAKLLMLSDARVQAEGRLKELRRDRDDGIRDITLGSAIDEFLRRKGQSYSKTQLGELKRCLEKAWAALHRRKLSRITERRVGERLEEI